MDYYVGSISDFLTGSNTPNKPKVVISALKIKKSPATPVEGEKKKSKKPKLPDSKTEALEKQKVEKLQSGSTVKVGERSRKREADSTCDVESPPKKLKKKNNLEKGVEKSSKIGAEVSLEKSANDLSAERRVKKKEKIIRQKLQEDPEELARTVFVGNLPLTIKTAKLKRFFTKYGEVESVRLRGVPVADPKITKKVAMIKKEFHPERSSFFGYVRFESADDAVKALAANGLVYKEHHLRVNLCNVKEQRDETKAIFIGNLSFNAEEEDLWELFKSCGEISHVRIVRDGRTNMGKGFGYVNFRSSDAVQLALEMKNVKLKDRELRISLCNNAAAKKNKKKNKVRKITKPGQNNNASKRPRTKRDDESGQVKYTGFQGTKFSEKKKKNKLNKGLVQKKKLIKKLAVNKQ